MGFSSPVADTRSGLNYIPTPEESEQPSAGAIIAAAFRQENAIVNAIDLFVGGGVESEVDFYHNPLDLIEGTEYEDHLDKFIGSENENETRHIMAKIDQENRDRETLASAGIGGLVAGIAAGTLDPTIALPGGALYRGVKTGQVAAQSAASVGAAAAGATAIQETVLQGAQATRTAEESALAIGGAAILGGLIGGGASALLSKAEFGALTKKLEAHDQVMAGVEADLQEALSGSVGAAQTDTRTAKLEGENILKKVKGLNRQDPFIRTLLKDGVVARRTMLDLAENFGTTVDNVDGTPTSVGGSVESRVKSYQGPLAEAVEFNSQAWSRYYFGKEKGRLSRSVGSLSAQVKNNGKLTESQFNEEVGRALRRGDKHEVPEVQEAAQFYRRTVFDPFKEKAIKAGLFDEDVAVTTAESYLTRVYNREVITNERGAFKDILVEHFGGQASDARNRSATRAGGQSPDTSLGLVGQRTLDDLDRIYTEIADSKIKGLEKFDEFWASLDDQEIGKIADEVINKITGAPVGRTPGLDLVTGPRGPLRERLLNIEDIKIEKYLESNVEVIARSYTRTMSADIELTRKFGDVSMEDAIKNVNDDFNRLANESPDGKPQALIEKQRKEAVRDIEAVRDRLRGTFAQPKNPDGLMVRTARVARTVNFMSLLGGMTISAFSDVARPIFMHGYTKTFEAGLGPLLANPKAFGAAKKEVQLAGTALDMVLDTRVMAIADMMDEFGKQSKFERGLKGLSSKFGLVSLMSPWNAALKEFSGIITINKIMEAVEAANTGTASPKQVKALAAAGFDENLIKRIDEAFSKHGRKQDGIYFLNSSQWGSPEAVDAIRAAIVREVDATIITPGVGDKPLWMSSEAGKTLGQFKSFGMSSVQKTIFAGLQRRDAAVFNGVTLMVALGALTYATKELVAGRAPSDDPKVWVANGLDRSGVLGWLADVDAIAYRGVGVSPIGYFSRGGVSRYRSRNMTGAIAGPSARLAEDVFKVAGDVLQGDVDEKTAKAVRRHIPFQNLFYLRMLLDRVSQ